MPFFRRQHERVITEEMAYARCHGDRGTEILSVKKMPPYRLPERRRGHQVSVAGETLRQAFAARLELRDRDSNPNFLIQSQASYR